MRLGCGQISGYEFLKLRASSVVMRLLVYFICSMLICGADLAGLGWFQWPFDESCIAKIKRMFWLNRLPYDKNVVRNRRQLGQAGYQMYADRTTAHKVAQLYNSYGFPIQETCQQQYCCFHTNAGGLISCYPYNAQTYSQNAQYYLQQQRQLQQQQNQRAFQPENSQAVATTAQQQTPVPDRSSYTEEVPVQGPAFNNRDSDDDAEAMAREGIPKDPTTLYLIGLLVISVVGAGILYYYREQTSKKDEEEEFNEGLYDEEAGEEGGYYDQGEQGGVYDAVGEDDGYGQEGGMGNRSNETYQQVPDAKQQGQYGRRYDSTGPRNSTYRESHYDYADDYGQSDYSRVPERDQYERKRGGSQPRGRGGRKY
uniref:DUF4359 domain-containing protein n=1 Tax=Syphacia muris TaxID=451379 RepID=A0A0N5AYC0_9BILA